jgi:cytochrome c2
MTANLAGARRVIRERSSWHFLTRKPHGANGVDHAKSSFVAHKTAIAVGFAVCPAITRRWATHAFAKYAFCHAKDKSNGIGPGLLGVIGRHAGSVLGFSYSQAMKNSNIVWDEKSLDAFLMTPQVGTTHRSTAAMASTWLRRNVRQLCEGGPRRWIIYFETVDSATSSPSFSSSPWIRGAPHNGFSLLIRRMR